MLLKESAEVVFRCFELHLRFIGEPNQVETWFKADRPFAKFFREFLTIGGGLR